MQQPAPQSEHKWLQRLVGEWTFDAECSMGPNQPTMKNSGKETVRSMAGLWTIGEGSGEMPEGGIAETVMTLGYDPQSKRFVGTFLASCMTHLWKYDGALDAAGKVLTLDTDGPSFANDGTMCKYQDIIEFISDDHRTLTSQVMGSDGKWQHFMTANYRRKK